MKRATMRHSPGLIALVHDMLDGQRFDSLADLADVVKARAVQLRLPYDSVRVAEAIDLVARRRPLLGGSPCANPARRTDDAS